MVNVKYITKNHVIFFGIFLFAQVLVLNFILPFPDNNDFYELSRIGLLMDSSIKYCVNSNWGFAHPLLCWSLTKITGNILLSQRLINVIFLIVWFFSLIKLFSLFKIEFNKFNIFTLLILFSSPWVTDIIISAHIDIAAIALVFAGLTMLITAKKASTIILSGFLVASSYWFRFHFLSFAILFPFLTILFRKDKYARFGTFLLTFSGAVISIAIPQILCKLSYGVFSISNEKFVLAQAIGIADWSYEFAQRLHTLSFSDMLKGFDLKLFILRYCYHFLKSGIFPFLLIFLIILSAYTKISKNQHFRFLDISNRYFQLLLICLYSIIAVVPFTVLRGFTYRLEAALIVFVIPVLLWSLRQMSSIHKGLIISILGVALFYHHAVYWKQIYQNRAFIVHCNEVITKKIPRETLKDEPQKIICCVDYYNPENKYRLCNPMVFAGWGVRFKPFIEHFGYIDLSKPFKNPAYQSAKYIIIPSNPEYFNYSPDLLVHNKTIYKDKDILIIERICGQ